MTRDAKELLDKRVIATDSGREIGKVEQLLFSPGQHALMGLVLKAEDGKPVLFLRRERVRSFGNDAITVSNESAVEVLDSDADARRLAKGPGHVLNMDVFTAGGDKLGSVDKVLLNEDGTVNSYRTSTGLLGMGAKQEIVPSDVIGASEDSIVVGDTVKTRN